MAIVGINPVSPRAQPQQQQREKESAFDKVMKGLSAANSAFGIAVNFQQFQEIRERREHEAEMRPGQLEQQQQDVRKRDLDIQATEQALTDAPTKLKLEEEKTQAKLDKLKAETAEIKSREALNQVTIEAEKRAQRQLAKHPSFKNLPGDVKKEIQTIAGKNAGVVAISSQISSALQQLKDPNLPKEDKIRIGQGLVKTLNSTEGSDAVGKEEAARLASELQSNVGKLIPDVTRVAGAAGAGAVAGTALPGVGTVTGAIAGGTIAAGTEMIHGLIDAMDDPGGLRFTPNVEGFIRRVELTNEKLQAAILRNGMVSDFRREGMSLSEASKRADEILAAEYQERIQTMQQPQGAAPIQPQQPLPAGQLPAPPAPPADPFQRFQPNNQGQGLGGFIQRQPNQDKRVIGKPGTRR